MIREFVTALRLLAATVIVCGILYPLGILAFARVAAPEKRLGSLVAGPNGTLVGSRLLAQAFTRPEYFWPRPSACGYDAAAAGGSNLSPANPLLRTRADQAIEKLSLPEGREVPADLVTASGSGLDPHIRLEAAKAQIPRIANYRQVSENEIEQLVEQYEQRNAPWAVGGSPLVNVLLLNLALDKAYPTP